MPLAKRARSVRRKKKPASAAAKKSSPKVRLRPLRARKRTRRLAARRISESVQHKLIREYHELVDKKLHGVATPSELADLEKTKSKMQAMEDAQTSLFEAALDLRHNSLMEKLSSLVDELRRFSAATQR